MKVGDKVLCLPLGEEHRGFWGDSWFDMEHIATVERASMFHHFPTYSVTMDEGPFKGAGPHWPQTHVILINDKEYPIDITSLDQRFSTIKQKEAVAPLSQFGGQGR